eukprot:4407671-Amphidinium_carterae.1
MKPESYPTQIGMILQDIGHDDWWAARTIRKNVPGYQPYGLQQVAGGPCGVLAVLQALAHVMLQGPK